MKFLLLSLLLLSSFALSKSLKPEDFKLKYQSFDGQIQMKCFHETLDEFGLDWDVNCKSEDGIKKNFRVHLALSKYTRPRLPRNSYEVMYWVTDNTTSDLSSNGTTVWFHFNDDTDLHSISLSQSVDKDTAGLYLDIRK